MTFYKLFFLFLPFIINIWCYAITPQEVKEKFILITTLYNEENYERIQEYIICLKKNMEHELIEKIYVVYDTSDDKGDSYIYSYLKTLDPEKIEISIIKGRVSYGFCFRLANLRYPNRKIILSNADIYFNETLSLLGKYNLENKFLALTRWNVLKDGFLEMYTFEGKPNIYSQDVWIFKTPLPKFKNDTIEIGTKHCNKLIAFQANLCNLKVFNPCLSIQCCHLHLSNIRHYESAPYPQKYALPLAWESL